MNIFPFLNFLLLPFPEFFLFLHLFPFLPDKVDNSRKVVFADGAESSLKEAANSSGKEETEIEVLHFEQFLECARESPTDSAHHQDEHNVWDHRCENYAAEDKPGPIVDIVADANCDQTEYHSIDGNREHLKLLRLNSQANDTEDEERLQNRLDHQKGEILRGQR